ncbi:hypothetical protein RR48_07027 [Papilio machaon]|uniref:Uncharacterized protein n=1 Tax=Papilio machaon TaxID=76193 RepID=A0A194R710_PAPMA|nr:hypothetical protein RR48_07027 [Papilio machaon]
MVQTFFGQLTKAQAWSPIKILSKYTPNSRECFCYLQKKSGTPVIDKLTNNGENLERLVVYLYKNPTTNEIKLFVPNNEKQQAIPDLSFDEGDQLEAPSDDLQTIFTKYPDLVSERSHILSPDIPIIERPIRKIKGINVPSKQNVIKLYDDSIFYDNQKPPRPKNTRNPTRGDSDVDYIKHQNLNIDLTPEMQPYFDFEGDGPGAPINVISVNINRKKADPNTISPHRGNIIKITRPNRDQFNMNLDSNNDLDDVIVDYPENSDMEETSTSTDVLENVDDDGDGDDIDAPDPEEIIAEKDFKDMPPELTDEITNDIDEPTPNRKILHTPISSETPKNFIIETHTVPTELSNTDTSTTDTSTDISIIENSINPIENEIQEQESDPDTNDEIVSLVENESTPQLDSNEQSIIINQNKPGIDDAPINDLMNYDIKPPQHVIIGPNNKPIGTEKITPISINVQKKLIDTLLPDHRIPIDYIKNEIFHNRPLIPGDLSYFTVHPEALIKKYQGVNGIDIQDTFDNWLDQQMKRVRFVNSRASNSIDIYTLKYLIEKTLHEKGMFVTDKGYIINSDGHILNTANLGLRPILIGNSVEYKNLLQEKFTTYKLPMDVPYLEAVLITSIDPPKILGIIPLGKTYLPKAIQKPFPYYVDNGLIRNSCGGVCNMRDMLVPSLNSRRHRGQTYIGSRPLKTRVTQRQRGRPLLRRRPSTRRIFPFDEVNTFIDKIYRLPLHEPKVIQRPSTYVVNYETGPLITREPVIKYPIPIAVSEVTPGFRIIGGKPATSSGTPVSSRGRSGYDSLESALPPIDNEN